MKNTVIFDLDGTLLNTLEDLTDAVNFSMAENGFPTHSTEDVRSFVGNGIKKLIERSVPNGCSEEMLQKCFDKTKPYSGIIQMLRELKKSGFKTAIVTNKADFAAQALCKGIFGDLITVTVGASENTRHKPYPDTTLKALRKLGAKAENAYFVGDSDVDVQTAANSGIDFIGVLWGFRSKAVLESAGATSFAENAQELTRTLLN